MEFRKGGKRYLKKASRVLPGHKADSNQTHSAQPASTHTNKPKPDYEKLGKVLFAIGETGTSNRKKLYKIAFWKGVWAGLGGAVGATIVVSILLWIIALLGRVPIVGPAIDLIRDRVEGTVQVEQ